MPNFLSQFFLGFLCSAGLFILSTLLVLGLKTILSYYKTAFYKKVQPAPHRAPKRAKTIRTVKPKRVIEINPDEVDQIFVKKVS